MRRVGPLRRFVPAVIRWRRMARFEAAAAGVPLITTRVGGIPEIFGAEAGRLVPPADPVALATAIAETTADTGRARNEALTLRARVQAGFSADAMTEAVLAAYAEARARRP